MCIHRAALFLSWLKGLFLHKSLEILERTGCCCNYNMVVVGSHRLYHTSLCQVVSPQGISIMLSVAHPKIPNCTVFLSGHTAHPGIVQQLCQTVWCRLFWYSQHLCWLTCACPSDGCWESADGLSPHPQQWHISLGCSNSV